MGPVRVKVYGLVTFTKRRYVGQLVVAGLGLAALTALWWLGWPGVRERARQVPGRTSAWVLAVGEAAPWLLLGGAAVQAVEAVVVLRRFARKERERGEKGMESTPAPPAGP